ncbi:helix-turn-helix domain-containing protein [Ruminococcaceae bacterium OttesenSCG-928-A16]|nr:helix-turn-helix domain-containing protein [Ruminococcaceae bacterium OttesenSCG-928-A16]
MKKYEELRKQYPEYISKIQLYQICGISPLSATYLLQNGIIPCIDTGKRTWRYRIALEDVITYLKKREKTGSMIPRGAVSSRRNYQNGPRVSFSNLIAQGGEQEIAEYFSFIYADCPDILTKGDVADMTGLSTKTILLFLKDGELKSIARYPHYVIPKAYLLEFVSTRRYIECKSNSEVFKKILGGFELWKTAK